MSLYDDVDTNQIPDWSSGINKLLPQPKLSKIHLQPKKASLLPPATLKPKIPEENKPKDASKIKIIHNKSIVPAISETTIEWDEFYYQEEEYNPAFPNEYEKIVKERREKKKQEDRKRHRSPSPKKSGFSRRRSHSSDEEESFRPSLNRVGTAIAPPKSLQESSPTISGGNNSSFGMPVAAAIMKKYGFKEGQGLGKQEQGISTALQVEKTSKRGGRIINEKDLIPQPTVTQKEEEQQQPFENEMSITDMMKNPSKVILLRNMVGPNEVDDELEPEVKDECTTKYGEVVTVHITEMPNRIPEETVRIFVEFRKIEHAIKALVDLNGRFFGGRQVRCCFYDTDKYENFIFDA